MSVTMRRRAAAASAAGFTLLELLIAMVVTLLVSGAVFGLLTASQTAFKREPQLSDRQQSIRQAMSMIQTDVMRAGVGLPPLVQAFTDGLDGVGPAGVLTAGVDSDHLEILAGVPGCPVGDGCPGTRPAGTPGPATVASPQWACVGANLPGYFAFFNANHDIAIHPVVRTSTAPGCAAAQFQLGPRMAWTVAGATVQTAGFAPIQVVRYEIAPCSPADPTPCLWRSLSGQFDTAGAPVGAAPGMLGNTAWQVVARGIDDLQVQYRTGVNISGAWADTPGPIDDCPGFECDGANPAARPNLIASLNTIVRHVQVTLSSRTAAGGLQGETDLGGTAAARVRGQLTGVFTPRAALATLNLGSPAPPLPMWQ